MLSPRDSDNLARVADALERLARAAELDRVQRAVQGGVPTEGRLPVEPCVTCSLPLESQFSVFCLRCGIELAEHPAYQGPKAP